MEQFKTLLRAGLMLRIGFISVASKNTGQCIDVLDEDDIYIYSHSKTAIQPETVSMSNNTPKTQKL